MPSVLLTGAAGFIGARTTAALLRAGETVFGVDRGGASPVRLEAALDGIEDPALTLVAGDLADRAFATSLVRSAAADGVDALVHLAWHANPADYLVSHENLASLAMTNQLIELCLQSGFNRLVVLGTCLEYAETAAPRREGDRLAPRSLYASAKHAAHAVASALCREAGARLTWARLFHLHGPGDSPNRLIPSVAAALASNQSIDLTAGAQVRDHLHVDDVGGGLAHLLRNPPRLADSDPDPDAVNLCSGDPVTLRALLETLAAGLGADPALLRFGARPYAPAEVMTLCGDATRLRASGFRPRFDLAAGLRDAAPR